MEISTQFLKTTKTARYVCYGNLSERTKYLWLVLHGSNMLCEQMIYKFAEFNPEEHFIIAPEGLSRFYGKGFGGEVLAIWMTSRDRLMEIEDFSNYLSKLWDQYVLKCPSSVKKIILGFSQGGTTAYRWLHRNKVEVDHLIVYSCWIPEDIELNESMTDLSEIKTIYTYGLQDQYLSEDRVEALRAIIRKNQLDLEWEEYEGDHRVSKKQLKYLFEEYLKKD